MVSRVSGLLRCLESVLASVKGPMLVRSVFTCVSRTCWSTDSLQASPSGDWNAGLGFGWVFHFYLRVLISLKEV